MKTIPLIAICLFGSFCFAGPPSAISTADYTYLTPVVFQGKIQAEQYSDPEEGIKPYTYWVLRLSPAIFVKGIKKDAPYPESQDEKGVKEMELVFATHRRDEFKFKAGDKVKVWGTLSHAATTQDHTSVLLDVSKIELVKSR